MLKIIQRGAFWYGPLERSVDELLRVYKGTTDKAIARRFKEALETWLARLDGDERPAASFAQAAEILPKDERLTCASMEIGHRAPMRRYRRSPPWAKSVSMSLLMPPTRRIPHGQAATKNSHVIAPAAAILHYAAENKLCAHIKVRRLKEKKSTRCPVHKDDATKLLDAATGDLRLLLIFLFHQGWRIGDTLRLTWRDIDLDAGLITYRISKTNDCLNSPLADAVIEAFRDDQIGLAAFSRGEITTLFIVPSNLFARRLEWPSRPIEHGTLSRPGRPPQGPL